MIGREKKKLKTFINGFFDGPHATPKESESGAIFLGIKNVTEDGRLDLTDIRYIADDDMPKWTKRVSPKEGDIVFSYEATLHRYAMIPKGFHGCLGRRMALLRVDETRADKKFILHYFLSPLWRKEVEKNILTGATVDRIPLTNVPDFEVHLPQLPIQKRIAKILSAYDDLIENNLKRIKLLEELAQRTYEEWFVKFRMNGEQLPINEITGLPVGWEFKKIGEVFRTSSGGTPSRKKEELYYNKGTINWIKTKELNNSIIIESEEKITALALKESSAKIFPPKTVLLAMYGNTIGETAFLSINAATNQACCAFLCEDREYRSYFIHQYLLNKKETILGYRMGAAQENISQDIIKSIEILMPIEDLIITYSSIIEPIYSQIRTLIYQNDFLKQSRDILLPRLMNGSITVIPES